MENIVKITLARYCIEELIIKAPIPLKKLNEDLLSEAQLTNNTEVSPNANDKEFKLSLTTTITFDSLPEYQVSCKMTGIFIFSDDYNKEEKEQLMTSTAPSALFGIMREILFTLTGKTPYFPLIVPIFDLKP